MAATLHRIRPVDEHSPPLVKVPVDLPRVPKSPEELLAIGAEIMADYMDPTTDVTEAQVLAALIKLFDNPTAIEAYDNEMHRRAGGRDVDHWH